MTIKSARADTQLHNAVTQRCAGAALASFQLMIVIIMNAVYEDTVASEVIRVYFKTMYSSKNTTRFNEFESWRNALGIFCDCSTRNNFALGLNMRLRTLQHQIPMYQ